MIRSGRTDQALANAVCCYQEALAPYKHIEEDLKSLKEVLEMKNQQIHQQDLKISELEKIVSFKCLHWYCGTGPSEMVCPELIRTTRPQPEAYPHDTSQQTCIYASLYFRTFILKSNAAHLSCCVFEQAEKNVYLEERLQVLQQQNEDLKIRIDKNIAVSRSDEFPD